MNKTSELWQKSVRNKKVASVTAVSIFFAAALIIGILSGWFILNLTDNWAETALHTAADYAKTASLPYMCICTLMILISSVISISERKRTYDIINIQKKLNTGKLMTLICNIALLPVSICAVTEFGNFLCSLFHVNEKTTFIILGVVVCAAAAVLVWLTFLIIAKTEKLYKNLRATAAGDTGSAGEIPKTGNTLMNIVNWLTISLSVLFCISFILLSIITIQSATDETAYDSSAKVLYIIVYGVVLFPYWVTHTIFYGLTIYSLLKHRRYFKTLLAFGNELVSALDEGQE